MRSLTATIITIGLCFAATAASARYFSLFQVQKIEALKVEVEGELRHGCLDNPDVLKTEAELVLRRSGIKVVEDNFSHYLKIHVIGYRHLGCSAYIGLKVYNFEYLADGTLGLVEATSLQRLHSGPQGFFPQQLRGQVNSMASQLANEILKARQ